MPGTGRRPWYKFLADLLAARPSVNANGVEGGDWFASTDALPTVSVVGLDAAGNKRYIDVLSGGGAAGWPKYVVATAAGPAAPYSTIQAAITAAAADGHGPAAPAVVLVMPGTYPGDFTVQPGIAVVGLTGDLGVPPAVTGHVTLSTAAGASLLRNLQVFPASGVAVAVPGNAAVSLDLEEVVLISADNAALSVTNTAGPIVRARRTSIAGGTAAGVAAVVFAAGGSLSLLDCDVSATSQSTMMAVNVVGGVSASRTFFLGQVRWATTPGALRFCELEATTQAALFLAAGAIGTLRHCVVKHTQTAGTDAAVDGSGGPTYVPEVVEYPVNGLLGAALTIGTGGSVDTGQQGATAGVHLLAAGVFPYTVVESDGLLQVQDTTADRAVAFPSAAARFRRALTVKDGSLALGTNAKLITVTPAAGQIESPATHALGASATLTTNGQAVTWYSDGTNWLIR